MCNNEIMKCAIVGLIRGYDFWFRYKLLIKRNKLIHQNFNYKYNYPLILFHEGDVKLKHQKKIKALTPNIKFVYVKDFHALPKVNYNFFKRIIRIVLKRIFKISYEDSLNGYKNMCLFYAFKIFDYVKEYDYYWRLDEDGLLINPLSYDPFVYLKRKKLVYGYLYSGDDSHQLTKNTLIPFVKNYIKENKLNIECELKDINMHNYGSNFMITSTKFWERPKLVHFLNKIVEYKGIEKYRWGDANIQALALKMFCSKDSQKKLPNFSYFHQSHNHLVET